MKSKSKLLIMEGLCRENFAANKAAIFMRIF